MQDLNEKNRYEAAKKKVKNIKGFYVHLLIFILVNAYILFKRYHRFDTVNDFLVFHNFSTLFFWGIGLGAHALSVFGPDLFLGKNWEERKIKEFMDREKNNKWE